VDWKVERWVDILKVWTGMLAEVVCVVNTTRVGLKVDKILFQVMSCVCRVLEVWVGRGFMCNDGLHRNDVICISNRSIRQHHWSSKHNGWNHIATRVQHEIT
jgi:hypothetical protein